MPKTILVVDDEQDILELLKFNLEKEGYVAITAEDGTSALRMARQTLPDLILLDIMLPGKDGWEVLRELGGDAKTKQIPVIFLTAKDSEIDEVVGLELGADDYIIKPISIRKLLARIKLSLRKQATKTSNLQQKITFGTVVVDADSYSVSIDNRRVVFTKKEFEILVYLAQRPGRVVTRETLLNDIWGDVVVIDRTIDVHIRKIREKLGDNYNKYIETIKGVGYRFLAEI